MQPVCVSTPTGPRNQLDHWLPIPPRDFVSGGEVSNPLTCLSMTSIRDKMALCGRPFCRAIDIQKIATLAIESARMFEPWNRVGGRHSIHSAIGPT